MNDRIKAYLSLHFCVFLWGFTAILGKLISLNALPLVWWRVFVCCVTLWCIIPRARFRSIPRRVLWRMFGVGVMVGVHWICFYGAIKMSNASIAVASMATTSFFSALTEPLIMRQKIKWYELALGILILPGMALIAGNISWAMRAGLAVGILGALLAAIFTSFNKQIIEKHAPEPLPMSFMELFGGLAVTSLVMPVLAYVAPETAFMLRGYDWLWLLVLAWVCTVLPYYLTLLAMRHITAFATNLTINLEPVYGVMLAALIFREDRELSPAFYTGVCIILLAVFGHPFLKKIFEKNEPAGMPVS